MSGDVGQLLATARRYHESGQLEPAERLYRQILGLEPQHAEALHLLGLIAFQCGHREVALAYMRQSLALDERQASLHNNLGEVYRSGGQWEQARASYERAVELHPGFAAAHYNLGLLFQALGQPQPAAHNYQAAIRHNPQHAEAYNNLGNLLREQGQPQQAIDMFRAALASRPDYAEAMNNLAAVLFDQRQFAEAEPLLRRAWQLQGGSAEVMYNLGNVYKAMRRLDAAAACYQEALRLQPEYIEPRCNLGTMLFEEGQLDDAEACFQRVLQTHADHVDARNNLGSVYREQERLSEAAACFEEVLRRDPTYEPARCNLGMVYLCDGRFREGWEAYEARTDNLKRGMPKFAQPEWDGGPLGDRTLLVVCEQGLGDTLQFIRYLKCMDAGNKIVVAAPPELMPLLRQSGFGGLTARDDALPPFDTYALLMSLPRLFGTRLDSIPCDVPYLTADASRVAHWAVRLGAIDGFRIGINWQGKLLYHDDFARAISLLEFAPLAQAEGVKLVSLQKGNVREQIEALGGQFEVTDLSDELDVEGGAFLDTVAVMKNLDLVITSDTSIAHLAGALGVPVWVALRRGADWRWMRDCADSPWYPTMRLFRQVRWREWSGVFRQMAEALSSQLATKP